MYEYTRRPCSLLRSIRDRVDQLLFIDRARRAMPMRMACTRCASAGVTAPRALASGLPSGMHCIHPTSGKGATAAEKVWISCKRASCSAHFVDVTVKQSVVHAPSLPRATAARSASVYISGSGRPHCRPYRFSSGPRPRPLTQSQAVSFSILGKRIIVRTTALGQARAPLSPIVLSAQSRSSSRDPRPGHRRAHTCADENDMTAGASRGLQPPPGLGTPLPPIPLLRARGEHGRPGRGRQGARAAQRTAHKKGQQRKETARRGQREAVQRVCCAGGRARVLWRRRRRSVGRVRGCVEAWAPCVEP